MSAHPIRTNTVCFWGGEGFGVLLFGKRLQVVMLACVRKCLLACWLIGSPTRWAASTCPFCPAGLTLSWHVLVLLGAQRGGFIACRRLASLFASLLPLQYCSKGVIDCGDH